MLGAFVSHLWRGGCQLHFRSRSQRGGWGGGLGVLWPQLSRARPSAASGDAPHLGAGPSRLPGNRTRGWFLPRHFHCVSEVAKEHPDGRNVSKRRHFDFGKGSRWGAASAPGVQADPAGEQQGSARERQGLGRLQSAGQRTAGGPALLTLFPLPFPPQP